MPKECPHCIFLSVLLIDSVLNMGKNYHLLVFFRKLQIHGEGEKDKQIY